MSIFAVRSGEADIDEYGVPVALVTSDVELDRVRGLHQVRAYRIASVVRICVVGLMIAAMIAGTRREEWPQQSALIVVYGFVAMCAAAFAFSPSRRWVTMRRAAAIGRFLFTVIDVITLTTFQVLSTDGIDPLLIMVVLPILLALDVSSRRAALLLAFSVVGFSIAMFEDPVMVDEIGWAETTYRFLLYTVLCGTAYMAVRIEERHVRSIAGLSALREELLAQTMTASEVEQRRISESIHDGPLQDILVVRQELVELGTAYPGDDRVERALGGLQAASGRLREAIFELHPSVLEQVGLGAAVEQLAGFTAQRSGIKISTDIDYPVRSDIDSIMFGAARELLSNVAQHSKADAASVALGITDGTCVLHVTDDGVGISPEDLERRLGEGHIGLASHRARVDAAGGRFHFLDVPVGTYVCVELPLKH